MVALTWDQVGERLYEVGVDHGVLYLPDGAGVYSTGVAWNGLTTVTESPTGAEPSPQYADNIKYLNLISAEEFGGTIEAFTYPEEFAQCDGTALPSPGIAVGQQSRKIFGLSYRTRVGNDIDGTDFGYKLHLLYGCQAAPSEKAYATINDSPEAIAFSWEVTTTPVPVTDLKPTSLIVIDSTQVDPAALADLEEQLYGDVDTQPNLPLPDAVIGMFAGTVTSVDMGTSTNQPTYDSGTHVVTLPAVTGVQWKVNGINKTAGAQPPMTTGQSSTVVATPLPGYVLDGDTVWTFDF
jgi:hypothetical protein